MIDAKRIEEMKRLSAEATKGPWDADIYTVYNEEGAHVAEVVDENQFANMHFIAESRQFVPDIIAAYEEQAEENARLRQALESIAERTYEDYSTLYKIHATKRAVINTAREALAWRNTTRK